MSRALPLLLACCVTPTPHPGHPLSPDEARARDAALIAWVDAGLPGPGDCLDRLGSHHTQTATEFEQWCWAPPDEIAACLAGNVVVYRPGLEFVDGEPVIHESMHALIACTGLADDVYDYEHADPRVWIQAGGPSSVQGRAMEALR